MNCKSVLVGLVASTTVVGAEPGGEPDFAAMMQPVPATAKFIHPDYYIWCGTMVKGDDGKYHVFYSRWPRALGHYAWVTHSEVAHAVGDSPFGPFRHKNVALPARGKEFWDGLCTHNASVTRRQDGGYLMVYKCAAKKGKPPSYGPVMHMVATSESPAGPFKKHPKPIFTKQGEHFPAEDPYIWHSGGRYWAIVKDMRGVFTGQGKSTALFESADGFEWKLAAHPLVATTEITWADGRKQRLHSLERPQLFFENGKPILIMFACDEDKQRSHSFNVQIPLVPLDKR